jgi:hypothetical protein
MTRDWDKPKPKPKPQPSETGMPFWSFNINELHGDAEKESTLRACALLLAKYNYGIIEKSRVKVLNTQAVISDWAYYSNLKDSSYLAHIDRTMAADMGAEIFHQNFVQRSTENDKTNLYGEDHVVKRAKLLVIKPKEK